MRVIAIDRVAGGQAPAVWSVALVPTRIADAVGIVDASVSDVLPPVVGIGIGQSARIDTAEGIVGEKEWSAPVGSERKLDVLETEPIEELTALGPAFVIGFGRNRIARRGRG